MTETRELRKPDSYEAVCEYCDISPVPVWLSARDGTESYVCQDCVLHHGWEPK